MTWRRTPLMRHQRDHLRAVEEGLRRSRTGISDAGMAQMPFQTQDSVFEGLARGGMPMAARGNMVQPRFALEEKPKMGWRSVFLVNPLGQLLNTEPVCAYPVDEHDWFGKWIVEQTVPVQVPDVAPERKELSEQAKQLLEKEKKK
jgi:hypothetical protein